MLPSPASVFRLICTSLFLSFKLGCCLLPTQAQVVSDQTLDSQVDRVDDSHLVITGGKEAGQNLFHSFSEFSVSSNSTVHFDNNANIENIFSRVTGGSISDIDGLIRANGNASLFLLNPAGIVFGPNAQLNLGGSFIATTAEAIVFPQGIEFSAVDTDSQPMLTVNIPIGLQYGQSPGAIVSEGEIVPNPNEDDLITEIESPRLSITPGNTLALIGGEIWLESTRLDTTGGRAELGSVSGKDFVALQTNHSGWVFNYEKVNDFSQVELNRSSILSGDGGTIHIQGKDIKIAQTLIENPTKNQIDGGDINVIATNSIVLDRSLIATQVGEPEKTDGNRQISGDGGNISLKGKNIVLSNGSSVSAETFARGSGGQIEIEGQDSVEFSGQSESEEFVNSSFISTNTGGEGAGGKIEVNTTNLVIRQGGQIQADSAIFAQGQVGDAGEITINASELLIENQGQISATTASGMGGEINLQANSIFLANQGQISARANSEGDGGNINITTDTLVLFDRGSTINAQAEKGNGGNINIDTQGLFVASDREKQITATSQIGIDGEVDVNTPDVDSEIDTKVVERSPLGVDNLIYTGCSLGQDYIKNQFNYIGRGGLPLNPMEEIATEDVMVDLGKVELPKIQEKLDRAISPFQYESHRVIREATSWTVNQKGNIELIAPTSQMASLSTNCQFHSQQ